MIDRLFPGDTLVCVGSGPSLVPADIAYAKAAGARILTINSAYLFARDADVIFGADDKWWSWHPDALTLPGLKVALSPTVRPHVVTLDWSTGGGLDMDPSRLRGGGHGGYAAINLSVHLGAKKIILLAYDLMPADNGEHHCHPPHPDGSHMQYAYRTAIYQTVLEPLKALGITLINASRSTALTSVPRADLAEALEGRTCPT